MKKLKKLSVIVTLMTGTLFTVSCEDDGGTTVSESLSITGIPAVAQIKKGINLEVMDVVLTAKDGLAAFTVLVDGGTAVDLTSLIIMGETTATINVSLSTTDLALGLRTLMFILTDINGDTVTVQHGLNINVFGTVIVNSNITETTTWSKDNVYILGTRVAVVSGVTLTIEAGTIIKGQAGAGANATALLIARGAKLNANGTASDPIIFTSVADRIEPGNIDSPNLDSSINGLWGGLLILGNANISAKGNANPAGIEGIPSTDPNGLYGGTTDDDNSGIITYVSVRHGGANIGEGNEINGFTLGGVGSGTTISHIEVVGNQDDGIEWFGGTVNVSHASVWDTGDDAIDTDQAWAGTLSNFVVISPGDEAFELDGPEGTYAGSGHTIRNGSVKVAGASGIIDFDDNTDVNMSNIFFFDFDEAQNIEGYSADFVAQAGLGSVSGFEATTAFTLDSNDKRATATETPDINSFNGLPVTQVTAATKTVGATISEFTGWTFADQNNALDDF